VTLTAVGTALVVKLRRGRVAAEGDLDVCGTLGIEKMFRSASSRSGFASFWTRTQLRMSERG
jgi:hypothetical protein